MGKANPWEVLVMRRKIKKYNAIGFTEAMKVLTSLRNLGLDKDILIATEVTRTLVWACNKTKEHGEDKEKRNFNVMTRFLIKEYKKTLGLVEAKPQE